MAGARGQCHPGGSAVVGPTPTLGRQQEQLQTQARETEAGFHRETGPGRAQNSSQGFDVSARCYWCLVNRPRWTNKWDSGWELRLPPRITPVPCRTVLPRLPPSHSSSVRQRLRRNFGEPKKSFLAPLQGERSIATQALRPRRCLLCCDFQGAVQATEAERPRRCLLCCDFAERSRDREFGLSLDISIIRHVSILARQRPGATSGWMEFSPCWRSGCIEGGRLGGWCRWGRCGAWRRSLRRCLRRETRGYRPGLGTRT